MKKEYKKPLLDVIYLNSLDILLSSTDDLNKYNADESGKRKSFFK